MISHGSGSDGSDDGDMGHHEDYRDDGQRIPPHRI